MPGTKVVAVPGLAKHKGKLLSVNRTKNSVTVVDPKTRRRLAPVPLPNINYQKDYLYYVKNGAVYKVRRAKKGMRADAAPPASSSEDSSDFQSDYEADYKSD